MTLPKRNPSVELLLATSVLWNPNLARKEKKSDEWKVPRMCNDRQDDENRQKNNRRRGGDIIVVVCSPTSLLFPSFP